MTTPVRLQLSRKKGFNIQALSMATNGLEAVVVRRPTIWGNKFTVEEHGRDGAVSMFEHDTLKFECFHPEKFEKWIAPLRGKNLACTCPPTYPDGSPHPCHADVLLELANGGRR